MEYLEYNWKKLLIPPLIAALFLWSWFSLATRPLWDGIDEATFRFLHQFIQGSVFWQHFWAFTSHHLMDWVHDIVMLSFFLIPIIKAKRALKARKIAECLFSILFMALMISIVNGGILPEFLHIRRQSPTMAIPSTLRLSEVIDWIKVKDHSKKCFPSDHALTATLFTCLIFYLMGWKKGLCAFAYAVFFCLPRLIIGAHWLTDDLIGSGSIAVFSTSLVMGTPFAHLGIRFLERKILRLQHLKQ
jgi:membrane-associated phospholipid phosphatase